MGQFLICKEDDSQPQHPAGAAAWPRFLYRSHSRDLGQERSGPACTRRPQPSSYEETGARSAPEVSTMSPPPRFLPAPMFQAVLGSLLRCLGCPGTELGTGVTAVTKIAVMESTPQVAFLVCGLGQFPRAWKGGDLFRLLPSPPPAHWGLAGIEEKRGP